jgi:acetyltransferase
MHGTTEARLSILVGDPVQGNGLGSELIRRGIDVARRERITRLSTTFTSDNLVMLHIFQKLGFAIEPDTDGKYVSASINL